MKVEQLATWVGLFSAIAGAAANYGITENKVSTLEDKMAELYNVEEIRMLERRLTTLEVTLENTQGSIGKIKTADTSEVENRASLNEGRIRALKDQIERIQKQVDQITQKLDRLKDSPL